MIFFYSSHNFVYIWLCKKRNLKTKIFLKAIRLKHRKTAAAVATKGDDYNPTEIAFVLYLAVSARPKMIHNHIVHSHHHLSRGSRN
jgi:hypothetical protein